MLPKKDRVDTKTVESIFTQGKFINSVFFTFKYIVVPGKTARISFIAPKNLSKLAPKRNLLRRKGYKAVRKYMAAIPSGVFGIFIFKKYETDASLIENDIKKIIAKIR